MAGYTSELDKLKNGNYSLYSIRILSDEHYCQEEALGNFLIVQFLGYSCCWLDKVKCIKRDGYTRRIVFFTFRNNI